jgi:anthranilate phosphoribosyltransferase
VNSAQICKVILAGREDSPRADVVALNAAAALVAAGLAKDFQSGFQKAKETLHKGLAYKKLEEVAAVAQSLAKKQKKTERLLKNKRKSRQ